MYSVRSSISTNFYAESIGGVRGVVMVRRGRKLTLFGSTKTAQQDVFVDFHSGEVITEDEIKRHGKVYLSAYASLGDQVSTMSPLKKSAATKRHESVTPLENGKLLCIYSRQMLIILMR